MFMKVFRYKCDGMTQEEKAKAYDEAIERAKIWQEHLYDVNDKDYADELNYIFPELAESEEERIREDLIQWINEFPDTIWRGHYKKNVVAWLEKQCEQKHKIQPKFKIGDIIRFKGNETLKGEVETHKIVSYDNELYVFADGTTDLFCEQDLYELVEQNPTDKVEPKFKVGDWITNGDCKCQIAFIDSRYWYSETCVLGDITSIDKTFHLWSIADAKDGDVLSYVIDEENLWIMIYQSLYEPYEGHVHYHALLVNDDFSDKGTCCICINDLKPATKEQRDLLFKKMKESEYTFDFEKKKLKKIVPIFDIGDTIIKKHNSDINKFGQFKITNIADGKYWYNDFIICNIIEQDEWELVEQKSAKWSEEDEQYLLVCKNALRKYQITDKWDSNIISQWLDDKLKSIRTEQTWSEEDETEFTNTTIMLKEGASLHFIKKDIAKAVDWLKSLRQRIGG